MVGYGENLGSGFPLILDAWKQAGWNTPVLNNKLELDMVELVLPLSAISKNTSNTTIKTTPSTENKDGEKSREKSRAKSREKSREKIINIIRKNPSVTQFELSTILQISTKAIEKHIKNLREEGIIRRVGPDNGGHWEIVDDKNTP
jgi:ATP-dependent DNA helicase RecG